jgi:hypothetical protein
VSFAIAGGHTSRRVVQQKYIHIGHVPSFDETIRYPIVFEDEHEPGINSSGSECSPLVVKSCGNKSPAGVAIYALSLRSSRNHIVGLQLRNNSESWLHLLSSA